jgi:hypothetical protein
MSIYGCPPEVGVGEALHLIFSHYCIPWKSALGTPNSDTAGATLAMDGASFARMCREAPELNKYIGRTDIDLIFSRTKPLGVRRLEFDHFTDTLLELAVRIFPDEDPKIALTNFIAKFIFALFDQPPAEDPGAVLAFIMEDLSLQSGPQ